jgi:hypothetical protein
MSLTAFLLRIVVYDAIAKHHTVQSKAMERSMQSRI